MIISKEEIKRLLEEKRYDELIRLAFDDRRILNALISLTYDKQNLICWRAIEIIGLITKEIAKTKPEIVRNLIGRLLWMIREESGGIGWSSPEILGEVVRNNPDLFSDIAPIIVSFLDEEKLIAGVLWAVGRIGETSPELVRHSTSKVLRYLHSSDHMARGFAAWALGRLKDSNVIKELERLKNDNNIITFYESGEKRELTIGEIAKESIKKLAKPSKM